MEKKANNAKVHFLQRKVIFRFEKQCWTKDHHRVSLSCDSLWMHLPFPILPVDSLGQSFHLSGVQPALISNLTSSSFGQGDRKFQSRKHQTCVKHHYYYYYYELLQEKKRPNKKAKSKLYQEPWPLMTQKRNRFFRCTIVLILWWENREKNKAFKKANMGTK